MSTVEANLSTTVGGSIQIVSDNTAAEVTIPTIASVKDDTTVPATTTTSISENDSTRATTNSNKDQPASSVIPKSKQQESDELTKRLQKLALERQKESKGERLKVIQNPDSNSMTHLTSVKTFQELNLPAYLLDAIFAMGFDRPSAIQEEALPRILADPPRNLIGQAQSGSGKVCYKMSYLNNFFHALCSKHYNSILIFADGSIYIGDIIPNGSR